MDVVAQRGNLDSRSQERELRVGLVSLGMALVLAAFLARTDAAPHFRWVLFLPFFMAVSRLLTSFYGTCGFVAIAGRRITCQGAEPVNDRGELRAQRRLGARLAGVSMALAVIATALFVNAK